MLTRGALGDGHQKLSHQVRDNPQRGRLVPDTVINTAIWRSKRGKGCSAPENTRQTYGNLHLHRYSTLTLLACLISHLLPLLFNLRNESAKAR
jgi:hypothetical protein